MSTMISEVYDAFVAAGAPGDKSKAAAEAIASYDSRFNRIEPDLMVLKLMVGAILAGVASLVLSTFFTV